MKKKEEKEYEQCVFCGKKTIVPKEQEIEMRPYYIEGAGQLCYDCYKKIYG